MKGFIRCNTLSRNLSVHDNNYQYIDHDDFEKYRRWDFMRKAGISPYPEFNFYVSNEFGAWMGNINSNIKNVVELLELNQIDLDTVKEIPYIEFIEEGYELVIGPGVPETDGKIHGNGVYCKNWFDILERQVNQSKTKMYNYK